MDLFCVMVASFCLLVAVGTMKKVRDLNEKVKELESKLPECQCQNHHGSLFDGIKLNNASDLVEKFQKELDGTKKD